MEEGLILIDKPLNWTSFDVVKKMRYLSKAKKIGHAGTLDPLASGLLILCFGKHTKKISQIQEMPKEYTGTFYLGATTPSFDLESEVDHSYSIKHITDEFVRKCALSMEGEIFQVPPAFSAVKVDGRRAYEMAREGQEVKLKGKTVTIHQFEITRLALPEIDFKIKCSKGTYIRSIARDFGKALNSGAHLISLRRTAIGDFKVSAALKPEELTDRETFYANSFTI